MTIEEDKTAAIFCFIRDLFFKIEALSLLCLTLYIDFKVLPV